MSYEIIQGNCLDVMAGMDTESFHAIVTDPPYGLGFMGKKWDHGVPGEPFWVEALRVAKSGAHLLAFGGTRTYHRLACAIEDAGWEIRDCLMWLYGSGFPKSLDVSKAIDKAAGAERDVIGERRQRANGLDSNLAKEWQGFGTALKPAYEPIILARKPLCGTVVENVLKYGCGTLDIDGSRIGTDAIRINTFNNGAKPFGGAVGEPYTGRESRGRWPANVLLDEAAARMLDGQVEPTKSDTRGYGHGHGHGGIWSVSSGEPVGPLYRDGGGASRFFYTSKASQDERPEVNGVAHPTVKPVDLMRYLIGLVSRDGDSILDPFAGSGSTIAAGIELGRTMTGIELSPDYIKLINKRMEGVTGSLFTQNTQDKQTP